MFLSIVIGNTSPGKKEYFTTTTVRSNGCILEISSQNPKGKARQNSRFTSISFNCSSNLMAVLDQNGLVFILDLLNEMYWQVPLSGFCSFIKFLDFSPRELLLCDEKNSVLFVNVDKGFAVRELKGHLYPVKFISSTNDKKYLMTSSQYETIIWDMDTNNQKHKLFLAKKIGIKIITFLPHSNNILACFQDDSLTVWSFNTFDCMQQFIPNEWRGHHLKCISLTRDGKIMAIGGVDTYITLFHMETWSLHKRIPLPIQISHVKYSTFLDNKILLILTGSGEIYFLDIETSAMKSSNYYASPATSHIYSVACSSSGQHIACSLYSGQILLFSTKLLLHERPCSRLKWKSPQQKKRQVGDQVKSELKEVNQKMSVLLDINRLRPLLKQFGEYPAKFRPLVWKTILKIPHNLDAYKTLDSKPLHWAVNKLDKKYPVQNSSLLKALKRLMSCLSHWNPLFSLITYLPEFIFPFVTLLRNEPCALFEIIVTIIVNYCQHWFQYFPFPPINTLALIENILADRDPGLLDHYYKIGLTSNVYAWLLLQSAFSEVLSESQWLVLWDHVLSNQPWFLLLTVVSFNIQCRNVILSMDKIELIENFFHSQNALDVHKLIKIAYELDSTVSSDVHPRLYYKNNECVPLIQGPVYQPFEEYPKFVVDYQVRKLNDIQEEEEKILKQEVETLEQKKTMEARMKYYLSEEIHAARMQELEDVYKTVLRDEEERVYREKLKLSKLKSELRKQEIDMMNVTRAKIMKDKADRKHASLDRLLDDIERKKNMEKIELDEIEENAKQHFLELLVSKREMEQEIDTLYETKCKLGVSERDVLEQQQEEVRRKLNELHSTLSNQSKSRSLHLAPLAISMMDDLAQRIELEIANELSAKQHKLENWQKQIEILNLETETVKLEKELDELLNHVIDKRGDQNRNNLEFIKQTQVKCGEQEKETIKTAASSVIPSIPYSPVNATAVIVAALRQRQNMMRHVTPQH